MIRLGKPVRLLEWGEGTNTLNQTWTQIGEGKLHNSPKYQAGPTTLIIEVEGTVTKKNEENKSIKVMQQGEGLVTSPERWGEVAMGDLKSISNKNGKTMVEIAIDKATKIMG